MRRGSEGVPVFQQLYLTLRQRISDGVLPAERPLPAEPKLATDFGVSRVTVRRALSLLERDGLVDRRRGAGTYVKGRSPTRTRISSAVDGLVTLGLETTARTLVFETARPLPFAARALGLADDAACLHIERLRSHAGRPFSLTSLWLPSSLARIVARDRLGDRPVIEILEEAGHSSASAEQTLSAIAADPRTAELLAVSPGSPLLRMQRIVRDGDGGAHLVQQSLYVPDQFEYRMELARGRAGPTGWRQVG
ncbi:MAG: GntR family transcriptional regulator [Alphaproteobacteria bacterium]|nr:GntR family transcriptional regulator [Alphaproteobacteria bacterium]